VMLLVINGPCRTARAVMFLVVEGTVCKRVKEVNA
jgi:hypothetical protein